TRYGVDVDATEADPAAVRAAVERAVHERAQADGERSRSAAENAEAQRLMTQADQEERRAALPISAAEHEPDAEERVRAAAEAEQREALAERVREDGRNLYDSAERRDGTARELEAKGINAEVVATRMRADVSQGTPATEAVKGAGKKAPKPRKAKVRGAQPQAQRTGLARWADQHRHTRTGTVPEGERERRPASGGCAGVLADVGEQASRWSLVGQRRTLLALVLLSGRVGCQERPFWVHQHRHVMVGVVAPPHAHPGLAVQAQVLPRPPQRFEPDHRLVVFPPASRPHLVPAVDLAPVDVTQVLPQELINGPVVQARLGRRLAGVVVGHLGGVLVDVDRFGLDAVLVVVVAPIAHDASFSVLRAASTAASSVSASRIVRSACGSCAAIEARTWAACGPVIHGCVRISVG